jgi:hypothetical protein
MTDQPSLGRSDGPGQAQGLSGDPGRADAGPLWQLILIPSAVTLAVTMLRLWGELEGWPSLLFNRAAGGSAALVGITWLVPVFGAWFALKLARGTPGVQPTRVLGIGVLALVVVFAINLLVGLMKKEQSSLGLLGVFAVSSGFGAAVGLYAWPALGRTLLAYGLAARIPVVLVTLAAIRGGWRTHYDALPPGFPAMSPLATWFWIGLLPQMTIWMAFTVIVGTIAGGLALLVEEQRAAGRRRAPRMVRPAVALARSAGPAAGPSPLVQPAPRVRPATSSPTVRPASPTTPAQPATSSPIARPASPSPTVRPASPSPAVRPAGPTPTVPPAAPPSIVQPAPPRGPRRT